MFREIILPIFRSTRLCVTVCGKMHPRCCRPATGRQHRGRILPQTVTHSLVPLKMGEIIAQNMLSWLELFINHYCCIYLFVYIIYYKIFSKLFKLGFGIRIENFAALYWSAVHASVLLSPYTNSKVSEKFLLNLIFFRNIKYILSH